MPLKTIFFIFFVIIQPFICWASDPSQFQDDLSPQQIHRAKLIFCIVYNADVLSRSASVKELKQFLETTSQDDLNPFYQCKVFLDHFLSMPQYIDYQQPFTFAYLDAIALQEIESQRGVFPTVQIMVDSAPERIQSFFNALASTPPKTNFFPLARTCGYTLMVDDASEVLHQPQDCYSVSSTCSHLAQIARYQMLSQGLSFIKEGLLKPLEDYYAFTGSINNEIP